MGYYSLLETEVQNGLGGLAGFGFPSCLGRREVGRLLGPGEEEGGGLCFHG